MSTFMLWWHYTNPSSFASVHNVMNWGNIKRICMGSLEHKSAHISPPNYNRMLNFGKWTFFVMLFPNTSTNPIISQIKFLWRHHFRTLWPRTCPVAKRRSYTRPSAGGERSNPPTVLKKMVWLCWSWHRSPPGFVGRVRRVPTHVRKPERWWRRYSTTYEGLPSQEWQILFAWPREAAGSAQSKKGTSVRPSFEVVSQARARNHGRSPHDRLHAPKNLQAGSCKK